MQTSNSPLTPEEIRHGNVEANTEMLDSLAFALMAHAPEVHAQFLKVLSAKASLRATTIASPGAKAVFKQRVKLMTGKEVEDL